MPTRPPRLAVRAVIVEDGRLLLVNAWPDGKSDLLCAPGGGVEPHSSLPDNLRREVLEETGLQISVGPVCLINEFHDAARGFHQVEIFFRARIEAGQVRADWRDPADVVTTRLWVPHSEIGARRVKPGSLVDVAFAQTGAVSYDPLEPVVR